ncbi:formate dehydrogenase accessory sulfurtransferase FdhD [Microbulbifer rhizosphaerae]|uniref:Sulfur carrier protein FdhD n=1 Tax=Microbulbifer rhizosphaerae TaxID=1562603 RepID=A0A7W4WE13_9GAMM|nr:formate dehydrogenase accessory sulfurtransferase FdhD [Microbulbifer rhizosphaerae]MBB3061987.1 FdhD protein [Microbulbifer rhizosphaerae]
MVAVNAVTTQAGCRTAKVRVRQRRGPDTWWECIQDDCLADETAIALVYNGTSHAVMMASPTDLEDFALGFSLSEGILTRAGELYDLEIADHGDRGIELKLHIHGGCMDALKRQHRTLAGPSGCGLCGRTSLTQALRPLPEIARKSPPTAEAVQQALQRLGDHQHLQRRTGAIHAAAWCNPEGQLQLLREDVGRHNALDKLIGALHRRQVDRDNGFVLVSSRASYELVAKMVRCDLGSLVAVSGATAVAVDRANHSGLNLIGFARDGRQVVYHSTDHEPFQRYPDSIP